MAGKENSSTTNLKMVNDQHQSIANNTNKIMNTNKLIITILLPTILCFVLCTVGLILYINHVTSKIQTSLKTNLVEFRSSINNNISENIIFLKILTQRNDADIELTREIAKSIYKWSRIYDKDPDLMIALIKIESNFDPKQISSATAEGLTQIMPFWYDIFKIPKGSFLEIDTSIEYGFRILALYEHHYQSIELALTAYNRGHYRIESDLTAGKDPANGYASKILNIYNELKIMNIGG